MSYIDTFSNAKTYPHVSNVEIHHSPKKDDNSTKSN